MRYLDFICPHCNTPIKKSIRNYNRAIKENPNYIPFCNTKCKNYYLGLRQILNCNQCGVEFEKTAKSIGTNNFCSSNCAAIHTNKNRKLQVITKCSVCSKQIEKKYNTENVKCFECKRKIDDYIAHNKRFKIKKQTCYMCNNEFLDSGFKSYCKNCLPIKQRLNGSRSASLRKDIKRSKNEIYFFELCKSHYLNVSNNQNIFDGWDADILLYDYKVAVLWNGPWHYVDCGGKHSAKQTQIRDKFKIEKIKQANWIVYIIKDFENFSHGKYSTKFVEQEFDKFKEFIKNVNI